ncbi:MAG TPA: Na(+)-translocating NADH-quinone reductase subunit C [Prevotella sp.]|nr:Na(+)-translocating NADH-quinone reductase subunit C [Candidatus Segatella violae]
MKTNSNSYTIIYSVIIVVIVAFLLAFVSSSLKDKQEANVALDTQKQILNSLNLRDLDDATAAAKYKEVVKAEKEVDGQKYYECVLNGQKKTVYTVKGMGLWGGISGFIAVDADNNNVYGAYFNHEGETAGLGAEIKDNVKWQEQFKGKKIHKDGQAGIALGVEKDAPKGDPNNVDAVTGATLTSNGVNQMLKEGLAKFIK